VECTWEKQLDCIFRTYERTIIYDNFQQASDVRLELLERRDLGIGGSIIPAYTTGVKRRAPQLKAVSLPKPLAQLNTNIIRLELGRRNWQNQSALINRRM